MPLDNRPVPVVCNTCTPDVVFLSPNAEGDGRCPNCQGSNVSLVPMAGKDCPTCNGNGVLVLLDPPHEFVPCPDCRGKEGT